MSVVSRTRSGLAYEVGGTGPAILLLHAGLHDRRQWEPQWRQLTERFKTVRYDARGFGDSADPRRSYTLHGDALDLLDALSIDRAAVIGSSMGGAAALDLALSVPHRVSALVTVGSTPSGWQHTPDILLAWEAVDSTYERKGLDAANELEMKMWLDGPHRRTEQVDRDVRRQVSRVNRVLLERQAGFRVEPGELEPPAIGRLGELRCPSLVVTGEFDQPSVLAGAFELASRTGADHAEILGAAHLPNLERPEEFTAALLPFLERTLLARAER
ncbi:MAG: alpha/beta hydrolase [Actinomycetota bacterium]|nr:alpha/beta hydrolase [Actinomycetota bacterium]